MSERRVVLKFGNDTCKSSELGVCFCHSHPRKGKRTEPKGGNSSGISDGASRGSGRSAIMGVPLSLVSLSLVLCVAFIAAVSLWRVWMSVRVIVQPHGQSAESQGE